MQSKKDCRDPVNQFRSKVTGRCRKRCKTGLSPTGKKGGCVRPPCDDPHKTRVGGKCVRTKGSRQQVWNYKRSRAGKLSRSMLKQNNLGMLVSKRASQASKRRYPGSPLEAINLARYSVDDNALKDYFTKQGKDYKTERQRIKKKKRRQITKRFMKTERMKSSSRQIERVAKTLAGM